MFSKVWTATLLVLALSLRVNAHAAVSPVLGVSGDPQRSDVKRPNNINPCGAGVNPASEIDSSTAAPADATGSFNAVVFNFNKGIDGSRKVSAAVDPTGTGNSFTAMTVTTNGDLDSKNISSQPIVAALPSGTTCTGGASGNLCLVQFKNAFGFGNCMVVSQGAANSTTADASSTSGNSTSTDSDTSSTSTDTSTNSTDASTDSADTNSTLTATSSSTSTSTTSASTDTSTASIDTSSALANSSTALSSSDSASDNSTDTSDASDASGVAGEAAGAGAATGVAGATIAGKLAGIKAAFEKKKAGAAAGGAIKKGIASKLAGLKAKFQGAAKLPGTARSLLANLKKGIAAKLAGLKAKLQGAAKLPGTARSLLADLKKGVAAKLAGLKAKLQGAAKLPGTRAARSLLAELRA